MNARPIRAKQARNQVGSSETSLGHFSPTIYKQCLRVKRLKG